MVYGLDRPKKNKTPQVILLALVLVAVIAALLYFSGAVGGFGGDMKAIKLRCVAGQKVTPFGNSVLYYDGTTLFCLNATGGEKWSYTLGSDAGFSCEGGTLVAWVGNQLFVFDENGRSTYNDHLSEGTVQFAKAGTRYVAAVVGSGISPTLIIKDLEGITVIEEQAAYEDAIVLDAGFFGDGEYLWTTSLDVYGTVPEMTLYTRQVGKWNSGAVSLGESLCYAIRYSGNRLNVMTTRQLLVYDYRGTQDKSATMLLYGWRLVDWTESRSTAELLFAPSRQTEEGGFITELRLIQGTKDTRITLPTNCVGAALFRSRIYAFGQDSIFRAGYRDNRFTAFSLPLNRPVTEFFGILSGGSALLACGNDVYLVTLK